MMKPIAIPLGDIYVPTQRRKEIKPDVVEEIAESIAENGLQVPIGVRKGRERYVLVNGLQRLEACRALGEETIQAFVVGTPQR